MNLLRFFSPVRAYRDLRFFLATRQRHELVFLFAAIAVTGGIIGLFVKDSKFERPYERKIIYVQNWRLDRSDAEIKAQQIVDQAKKDAREAELKKKKEARQAEFKRLDEKLEKWGL